MSDNSKIEWTEATWSPIRARVKMDAADIARDRGWNDLAEICEKTKGHAGQHCEFISPGCVNCYSCTNQARCLPANGTGLPFDKRARELVEIFIDEDILRKPLHWTRGRKIFVENQSDLFGEWVPDEMIDRVYAVMALADRHTYQVLTKRMDRALLYLGAKVDPGQDIAENEEDLVLRWGAAAGTLLDGEWIFKEGKRFRNNIQVFISHCHGMQNESEMLAEDAVPFPLPNVWLGCSVENQAMLKRIDTLKDTAAAVRFVSFEPLLEDLGAVILDGIDWAIIGGESGNGARPLDIAWIRSLLRQCVAQSVAPFIKQFGAKPFSVADMISHRGNAAKMPQGFSRYLNSKKGGDMAEWPEDLRVREFPPVA